ncbi:hypothetical protein MAR_023063 [Mya arenaria]|uniref:Uncharacterized protein n=1 Tax=Mya arenaria TaxID=6604 RepID=A0ABY7DUT4_MYAAR|nr:hypothetical protein MAR_023063 [Mya arenaria]
MAENKLGGDCRPSNAVVPQQVGHQGTRPPEAIKESTPWVQEGTCDPRRVVSTSARGRDGEYQNSKTEIIFPPALPDITVEKDWVYIGAQDRKQPVSLPADEELDCEQSPVVSLCNPWYKDAGKSHARHSIAGFPGFPQYFSEKKRLQSFKKNRWPSHLPSPERMAKAGLFFKGGDDRPS